MSAGQTKPVATLSLPRAKERQRGKGRKKGSAHKLSRGGGEGQKEHTREERASAKRGEKKAEGGLLKVAPYPRGGKSLIIMPHDGGKAPRRRAGRRALPSNDRGGAAAAAARRRGRRETRNGESTRGRGCLKTLLRDCAAKKWREEGRLYVPIIARTRALVSRRETT